MAKFLLVTHIYPPAIDGGSKVIYQLGQYLKKQGHRIKVLSSNASSTDDFTHPYKKIKNKGLSVYTIFHKPLKLFSKVLSKGPIFKFIPFVKFIIEVVKYHPDYIIAGPLPTTTILYANLIKKLTRAKLIINASFHHNDSEFSQPLLIKALRSSDFIWTLTDFETKYFNNHFQIPLSKIINVGNGVESSFLIGKSKPTVKDYTNLLFVGSLAAHKGLDVLIDAFCFFEGDITLTIAGQETLFSPQIRNKVDSLSVDIKSRIKFAYNFKSSELADLIDRSTILISPSTQESFGLVIIEALARKVPVVAANIPASTELITKTGGGLLFKKNNPSHLADQINAILTDPSDYGQKGYQYVKSHYTWDKIGKTIWSKISSS